MIKLRRNIAWSAMNTGDRSATSPTDKVTNPPSQSRPAPHSSWLTDAAGDVPSDYGVTWTARADLQNIPKRTRIV